MHVPLRARPVLVAFLAMGLLFGLMAVGRSPASAEAAADRTALTNLAHLDFLRETVAPPEQAGHTTYRLAEEPRVGTLWTYANREDDGSYRRVGGGAYDPTTGWYGQGAFDADDIARAAVVYLRHWRQDRAGSSRDAAYELLRGLTYLQTASGPNAGNVVLWMQSDGTLHPSPTPADAPDPSDSGASYWLARTVWALGEGYQDFRTDDPGFARFLGERMQLAVAALDRQVLTRYGQWRVVDGKRVPAWLVVDGADATAEAVLGLSSYVAASDDPVARQALDRLAAGVAAMSGGDAGSWPYGAVLPSAQSQSQWHAWASQMPAALARASQTLRQPALLAPALEDSAVFTPYLLTAGGPDNGWLPAPVDRTQIAYGVDSRVQSLLATADAGDRPGLEQVAGLTAAWYFGANAAGVPTYDPSTGVTYDGVAQTARSTATPAPSRPSTACCRCWRSTPTRRPLPSPSAPGPSSAGTARASWRPRAGSCRVTRKRSRRPPPGPAARSGAAGHTSNWGTAAPPPGPCPARPSRAWCNP